MSLLDTLTRAADEEQLRLKPLPEHAVAQQPEHLRRHYALLLAAVLTSQSEVSDAQTRLLRLLLDSLKLGDIRGPLFEQARELKSEPLLEAARLIREAGFAQHLVVDVLVLLRLDAPLGEEAVRLAGELAAFLGLEETVLAKCAGNTVDILGLSSGVYEADSSLSDKEGEDAEDSAHGVSLIAELWPSRLPQPLTADALREGLQGGLWLLDANLNVDFPWQANDAILVFLNGATLSTFAKKGDVKLIDSRLIDAVLDFQGKCSITVERCNWEGDYDPHAQYTTLNSIGQTVNVIDCQFSTRNARAISIQNGGLTLKGCRFNRCGHSKLNGGAIENLGSQKKSIQDCSFFECQGLMAGAIYVEYLNGIKCCQFFACSCIYESFMKEGELRDYAIYCGNYKDLEAIENCVFQNTSLSLYIRVSVIVARGTQFINSSVYYGVDNYGEPGFEACSFAGGSVRKR